MGEQKKTTGSPKTRSEGVDPVFDEQVTKLVLDIQNNKNSKANKDSLALLILPFISKLAYKRMPSFYDKSDADEAVQEFIYKHILNNSDEQKMYIYQYKHAAYNSFCNYLVLILIDSFFKNWKRKYHEANHRGPSFNDDGIGEPGKGGLSAEYEISKNKYRHEEKLRYLSEYFRSLAQYYLEFINYVNSLDKEKTFGKPFQDGERVVNEQKLLCYYIRFINSEFLLSPKSRDNSIEQMRLFSYSQVNRRNNDYLKSEIFMVTIDFMKLLEERIISRDLADSVFLPLEKNIRTTVDEWLRSPRMKEQIDREYARLEAVKNTLRKDYYDGI